ncbi:glucosaminidase domain-containing protein [Ignavigranum ruoffiae]|uniref:glucosaminidase domain-containing protein n=1 Tax=Ignavigranum ruoffiae TaxID=89093 RepID=UPI0023532467|nr:glucosaminidase domain-containing protein [Ignavigranum ruoffiae]
MNYKEQFIQEISTLVEKYPSEFFNSISIAQACLETGFGQSELVKKANNLFGYKAKSGEWQGEVFSIESPEENKNGQVSMELGVFRKYNSWEESVKDHANMMVRTKDYKAIYQKAINAKTPEEQARALSNSYATDSSYGNKLIKLIQAHNLTRFDKGNVEKDKQEGTDNVAKMTLAQALKKLGLKFTVELLPLYKTFGKGSNKQIGVTLHQTGAPSRGSNARAMANYQRNMATPSNPEEKSWHLSVDDTEAIQSYPFDVGCWASSDGNGRGNMHTIQIESCINADGNYAKTIDNTAKLMAGLFYVFNLNPDKDLYTHYYWSTKAGRSKWCPQQILNGVQGYTLAKVVAMTKQYLAILNDEEVKVDNSNHYNPQGLEEFPISSYVATKIPYKLLSVGDKVTLKENWLWYNPESNKQMLSKKQEALTGATDEIAEVKDIKDIGHSRYAYKLKKFNSWILEEDLLEPMEDWKEVEEVPTDIQDEKDSKEGKPLPEGQFMMNGKLYQVQEVA